MSGLMLNNRGNSVEGRIERLQIQRSDGSIREDRKVNIHNTIVNTGLDSILTFGEFSEDGTNSRTITGSSNNEITYDASLWVRMTWYTKIGTGNKDIITQYDMTDLVNPYYVNGVSLSNSHYIPVSEDLTVRGTSDISCIYGNVQATHRVTNNSLKVSEDGVEITEIGFFTALSNTATTAFGSQNWISDESKVPMFSRIALGDNSVILNSGERLVITYAITEYASNSAWKTIDNIGLKNSDGVEIQYTDDDGINHSIGCMTRGQIAEGRDCSKPPFHYIDPLVNEGRIWPNSAAFGNWYNHWYTMSTYFTPHITKYYYNNAWWFTNSMASVVRMNGALIVKDRDLKWSIKPNSETGSTYTPQDEYLFPVINGSGCPIIGRPDTSSLWDHRCFFGQGSGIPRKVGYSTDEYYGNDIIHHPTIEPYYRCSNKRDAYRDLIHYIPTYMPVMSAMEQSSSMPKPNYTSTIYWLIIRGMIYKFGYFDEPGNAETFHPCPIKKKAGQVLKITFRETISRHRADEET